MQMRVASGDEPAQVGLGLGGVLAAGNGVLHRRIEALDANFKLQHPGGKARDAGFEPLGQLVGHEFEVHKQGFLGLGGQPGQKELQNLHRGVNLEVESAVHELEGARTAGVERREFGQKGVQVEGPGGFIQRA